MRFYLQDDFEKYIVIGFYYNSTRKFKSIYSNWAMANGVNLWNGNVYGILKSTGKRIKLKSVCN
jgi:hypothetical protein